MNKADKTKNTSSGVRVYIIIKKPQNYYYYHFVITENRSYNKIAKEFRIRAETKYLIFDASGNFNKCFY